MLFDVGVSGRILYSIVRYLLAHLSRRLIGEALSIYRHSTSVRPFVRPSIVRPSTFDWLPGQHKWSASQKPLVS